MPSSLRAFTLVEMLVSLAVLVLAMTVVGSVFTITTRTASQAAAYSETLNWVRQWSLQIEEDLRYCAPSQSILVLVGRTVPAALTQADLDAGKYHRTLIGNRDLKGIYDAEYDASATNGLYGRGGPTPGADQYSDPRADLLMFISNRPSVSQSPATAVLLNPPANPAQAFQSAAANGVKLPTILAVYGHAALGEAVWNGTSYEFPADAGLTHIETMKTVGGRNLSAIPLTRWPLSRRATILQPTHSPTPKVSFGNGGWGNEWRICIGEADDDWAGDTAALDVPAFLSLFGPNMPNRLALEWPYTYPTTPGWTGAAVQPYLNSLLYNRGIETNHHVATVLENVPLELRANLGLHMLPGCAWFQVEFLMPEDPRNSVQYTPNPNLNPPSGVTSSPRSDMERWTAIQPGQTYVFVPDTTENRQLIAAEASLDPNLPPGWLRLRAFGRLDQDVINQMSPVDAVPQRVIRLWPYAIRVTVHVYDRQGRLTEPIVRSVVHRFE